MKKSLIIGIVASSLVLISAIGGASHQPQSSSLESTQLKAPTSNQIKEAPAIVERLCDGIMITEECTVEGVQYSTYVLHEAVPEKSHITTTTTYTQEIADYCTLCSDGSYSPSCATGRGACSHHGGVAQWNAPRYRNMPKEVTEKIIDQPSAEAYYEKIAK